MKRLIRKAESEGNYLDSIREKVINELENTTNMTLLNNLDAAEVRHDKCIVCDEKYLVKINGMKLCKNCGTFYKIIEDKVYLINE